jgi:hypothetical protein
MAPIATPECFWIWLLNRRQKKKESQEINRLTEKWRKNFQSMERNGTPRQRQFGRESYYRHIEKNQARARVKMAAKRACPSGKIEIALRRRLYDLVRRDRATKGESALLLVGCSLEELRSHLENQFSPGMSWENYGSAWHIDHRRPCAKFNLLDANEQRACFHFWNLQPLWAFDNLSKGAR